MFRDSAGGGFLGGAARARVWSHAHFRRAHGLVRPTSRCATTCFESVPAMRCMRDSLARSHALQEPVRMPAKVLARSRQAESSVQTENLGRLLRSATSPSISFVR